MNLLDTIVQQKQREVAEHKSLYPVSLLERSRYFPTKCVSMKYYLEVKNRSGIIAEFKRRSPSKGWINQYAKAGQVTLSYMQAGAAALSVLTDSQFFGGQKNDLEQTRDLNYCPILRKDFMIDEYQIIESKAMGADVVLLIAKLLTPAKVTALCQLARSLGMEVLLEIQDESEAKTHANTHTDLIGINNRNLEDFSVDFENSCRLLELLPDKTCKIAESGIQHAEQIDALRKAGFRGFLIGTQFMQHSQPGQVCKELIQALSYED